MSDMIERCAKAIYEKFENRPAYAKRQMNGILAEELARAAIKAMREPTQEMTIEGLVGLTKRIKEIQGPLQPVEDGQVLSDQEAAHRYMNLGALARNGSEVDACWRAMIDAALSQDTHSLPPSSQAAKPAGSTPPSTPAGTNSEEAP